MSVKEKRRTEPNFQDGVKAWIENGGGRHIVASLRKM
ncbi:L-arabinose isomerase [Paenibacillus harenae]|nr:L-arabinose isomerase [Paenibacillus harenae]